MNLLCLMHMAVRETYVLKETQIYIHCPVQKTKLSYILYEKGTALFPHFHAWSFNSCCKSGLYSILKCQNTGFGFCLLSPDKYVLYFTKCSQKNRFW